MAGLSQRTAHATFWSAAEIAARYGAQIIVTIVLARLLSPEDFGLIAMLLVFTSIGALLTDGGFGTALIQRKEVTAGDETTVFFFTTCSSVFMAGLLWIGAEAIARFYSQPELAPLTRGIAFTLPLGALGAVPDALLTKRLDFRARASAQIIASLISGAISIVLAWRGLGVWSLVGQALAATGLRSAMLWLFARWRPCGSFRMKSFHALFGFGGYMLLAGLLNTISVRLQSLVIGKLFDATSLGYYSLAQSAQQAPTSFIGALLGRIGLPVFSTMSDQPVKLRTALRLSLQVSLFVFIPCMVGIAVAARPLIVTIYGDRWAAAAPMLTLLALAGALWPMHVLNLSALSAQGRSNLFFRLEVIKDLITVVLTLLVSPLGPVAIAGAMLGASLFSAGINTWYSHKLLNFGLMPQFLDQKSTLLLSLLAAIPAWCILHWTRMSMASTLVAIAVATSVYLGGAVALRHPALPELLNMGRKLFGLPQQQATLNDHA